MNIILAHKYWYQRRGAERYVFALRDMLERHGHQAVPFSMSHPLNEETKWSKYFVPLLDTDTLHALHIPAYLSRAMWSRVAYRQMRALIVAASPDVVHAHNIYTHLSPSVLAAAKAEGVPVVMTIHDYGIFSANYALWSGSDSLYPAHVDFVSIVRSRYIKHSFGATAALEMITRVQRALRLYDKHVDQFIAVSTFVKEVMVQFGIAAEKITVLHPLTSMPRVPRADVPRDFFYFGALEKSKGLEVLIEAIDLMGGGEILHVAGAGPLKDKIIHHPRVNYIGQLTPHGIATQLAHVRAAIVPSLWDEPFGLSALESMLTHTPVIVSSHGGLPELVAHGECGIVTRAGDANDLARTLQFVVNHPEALVDKVERAYARAQEIVNEERHLQTLLSVYNRAAVDKSI